MGDRRLTVPADLDSLDEIASFVKALAADGGLDADAAYRLRLAVDEIATNIVSYGYGDGAGTIDLEGRVTDARVVIVVSDTGAAFDPLTALPEEEKELDKPLEERRIGGLGIHLAVTGVDSFTYARDGGVNRNTFVVERGGTGPSTCGEAT